jgi:hypothetical protein
VLTKTHLLRAVLATAAIVVFALAPAALAGKGGKGSGAGNTNGTAPTGSLSLVQVDSTDGVAHWGQRVTFNASSSATYYFVAVRCSQNGATVYKADKGFYASWPADQRNFWLMSSAWTGGAADCTAELYAQLSDGSNRQSLVTIGFPVAA